jgi:hypothetical protein
MFIAALQTTKYLDSQVPELYPLNALNGAAKHSREQILDCDDHIKILD